MKRTDSRLLFFLLALVALAACSGTEREMSPADLEEFAAGGIRFHTQIVLQPGVNDGAVLRRSLEDLYDVEAPDSGTPRRGMSIVQAFEVGLAAEKTVELVKSLTRRQELRVITGLTMTSEVPFPEAGRSVALRFQMICNGVLFRVQSLGRSGKEDMLVHPHTFWITPREQRRPGGRTLRH